MIEALPIVKTPLRMQLPDISEQAGEFHLNGMTQYRILTWRRCGFDVFNYVCMDALGANMREEDCSTPYFKGETVTREVEDWMYRFGDILAAGASMFRR